MTAVEEILSLFRDRGGSLYGGEAVTQSEHALQAAWLAERDGADAALIAAALLHDIGHLSHDLPDDAPERGIDDRHEDAGDRYLREHFPADVTEPVRLHVDAKRYRCTTEPGYFARLSAPSVLSLELQGGLMTPEEVEAFRANPHSAAAVRLRGWDDEAKVAGLPTPSIEHFTPYLSRVVMEGRSS